jgi:hypothetical protein
MDSKYDQNLLNAEQARVGLAADMRNISRVRESLIRHGKRELKTAAMVIGAVTLGGLVVGVALGRISTGRRASSMVGELLGRATTAFVTSFATQLWGSVVAKGR